MTIVLRLLFLKVVWYFAQLCALTDLAAGVLFLWASWRSTWPFCEKWDRLAEASYYIHVWVAFVLFSQLYFHMVQVQFRYLLWLLELRNFFCDICNAVVSILCLFSLWCALSAYQEGVFILNCLEHNFSSLCCSFHSHLSQLKVSWSLLPLV